jgi:hypothetical protein
VVAGTSAKREEENDEKENQHIQKYKTHLCERKSQARRDRNLVGGCVGGWEGVGMRGLTVKGCADSIPHDGWDMKHG